MQTIHDFLIKVDKPYEDTISYGSLELHTPQYVTKFNQHSYSVRCGKVLATPANCDYPIKKGDVLYFDYLVIEDDHSGYIIDSEEGLYKVPYTKEFSINNMAYAWENEDGIHMINDWVFCEPAEVEEQEEILSSGIILPNAVKQKEEEETKKDSGYLRFANRELIDNIDLPIDAFVKWKWSAGWDIKIKDKEYKVMQVDDIVAVING